MQLGDPRVLETSSGEAMAGEAAPPEGGEVIGEGGGSGSGGDEGDKINFGGNRWPRQETLALLKIRSDMDAVFRDSSLKGPLWEDVSRKLAALGYHRSAKKCKEKFENVYKYHKRTKESRSGKSEGKTYKFFDQLQALENQFTVSSYPQKPQPTTPTTNTSTLATNTVTLLPTRPSTSDTTTTTPPPIPYATTVPSTNPTAISPSPPPTNATTATTTTITSTTNPRNPSSQANTNNNNNNTVSYSLPNMNLFSSTSTSSSTASDEDLEEKYRKKRKWKEYFRRLTRQVLAKQEEMQKRFLEAIDKREREQVAQQDAWRMQEMARINREHEILVQERSTAAAKDAAVIAFLQKLSGQQSPITTQVSTLIPFEGNFLQQLPPPPQTQQHQQQLQSPPPQPMSQQVQPQQQQQLQPPAPLMPNNNNNLEVQKVNNGHSGAPLMSPSRWPKAEVHALIRLRTSLEARYQENGPKAPLWEDISAGMQRLGYHRSAKRCKEKWENINKYFKKVKESKKQRREDSKTCPYFQELDALYKEKSKNQNPFGSSFQHMKPNEMMEPLMVQPEQQWRPPPQYEQHEQQMEEVHHEVKNNNNNNGDNNNACQYEAKEREAQGDDDEEEVDDNGDDDGEDGDSVEDEGGNSRYEIATNKLSSVDTVE